MLQQSVVLAERSLASDTTYGFALVNALILAKIMLVAEGMGLGRAFEERPLFYSILYKSGVFAMTFLCFHVLEHTLMGVWNGHGALESVPRHGSEEEDRRACLSWRQSYRLN